jgi:hypothetical protein
LQDILFLQMAVYGFARCLFGVNRQILDTGLWILDKLT